MLNNIKIIHFGQFLCFVLFFLTIILCLPARAVANVEDIEVVTLILELGCFGDLEEVKIL